METEAGPTQQDRAQHRAAWLAVCTRENAKDECPAGHGDGESDKQVHARFFLCEEATTSGCLPAALLASSLHGRLPAGAETARAL